MSTRINTIYLKVTKACVGMRPGCHILTCAAAGATEEEIVEIGRSLVSGTVAFLMNGKTPKGYRTFSVTIDFWERMRASNVFQVVVRDFKPDNPERLHDTPGVLCINPTGLDALYEHIPEKKNTQIDRIAAEVRKYITESDLEEVMNEHAVESLQNDIEHIIKNTT